MDALIPDAIYLIELCSGERRRWRYRGPGAGAGETVWWRDIDSGREFIEASLMYAWTIIRQADASDAAQRDDAPPATGESVE